MNDPRALKEVWSWKEKAYQELKSLSMKERIKKINKTASNICRAYGLSLKKTEKFSV